MSKSPEMPASLRDFPPDAPRWVHVDGFDVQVPDDIDPGTMDRLGIYVEAAVLYPRPDFQLKPIKDRKTKQPTGRFFRTAPRWLFASNVVAGSPEVKIHRQAPQQMTLLSQEEAEQEEEATA